MDLAEFTKRFKIAASFCRDFTNKHITDELSHKVLFIFSEKSSTICASEAINTLYRHDGVPVWINFYVTSYNQDYSVIKITYSEAFSTDENQFYHKHEGIPPFHAVGPTIPEGWNSLAENGPFEFQAFK
ncbi:MAG: hypothetical protein MK132_06150 [Lentisphaerales bacterium]|nr:hypothetical protein [Lentisphaerales bacterium]